MVYIKYLIPAFVLIICAALYFFENKVKQKQKIIFSVINIFLHIFIIVYFLFIETKMEMPLLFLTASLALSISAGKTKP